MMLVNNSAYRKVCQTKISWNFCPNSYAAIQFFWIFWADNQNFLIPARTSSLWRFLSYSWKWRLKIFGNCCDFSQVVLGAHIFRMNGVYDVWQPFVSKGRLFKLCEHNLSGCCSIPLHRLGADKYRALGLFGFCRLVNSGSFRFTQAIHI